MADRPTLSMPPGSTALPHAGQFRGHLCDGELEAALVLILRAPSGGGHRCSRSTSPTPASRRLRREGQCLPSSCFGRGRGASPSRPRIRPISARSSRPTGRRTSPTATCRTIPFNVREAPRDDLRDRGLAARRPHAFRASGGRTRCRCASATASRPACICCNSGRAIRSAPTRCWCSIPPTATGARVRCRRRTCAGAPTARRSWSGRSKPPAARSSTSRTWRSIRRRAPSRLNFVRGGSATLRLDKLDQERIVLDVALERADRARIGRSRRCARCS